MADSRGIDIFPMSASELLDQTEIRYKSCQIEIELFIYLCVLCGYVSFQLAAADRC